MLNSLDTGPDSLSNQSNSPHGSSGSIRTDGERSTPSPSEELNKHDDEVPDCSPSFQQNDDEKKIFSKRLPAILPGDTIIQSRPTPIPSELNKHDEKVAERSSSIQQNDDENKNLLPRQLQAIPSDDTLGEAWTDTEQTPRVRSGSPGCYDGDVTPFISAGLNQNTFISPERERVPSVSTGDSSNEKANKTERKTLNT